MVASAVMVEVFFVDLDLLVWVAEEMVVLELLESKI